MYVNSCFLDRPGPPCVLIVSLHRLWQILIDNIMNKLIFTINYNKYHYYFLLFNKYYQTLKKTQNCLLYYLSKFTNDTVSERLLILEKAIQNTKKVMFLHTD